LNRRSHALTEAERGRIDQVDRLVAVGERGVRDLIRSLSDSSWTVRRAVVAGLASLGDDAVEPLCTFLGEDRTSEAAIAAAVDALSTSIGGNVTPRIIELSKHANPAVVADAAQILGRRRASEASAVLAKLVEHLDDNVAVASIEALGMIGGTAAVEALIRVVESKNFFRTFPAIQVLARTGDPRAVPPLASLLTDDTYRYEVVRALGRTGSAQAIAPVLSVLKTPGDAVVRIVACSLADLIERAEWTGAADHVTTVLQQGVGSALPRFISALRGGDPEERTAIAKLLGRAGDPSVLSSITSLLDDTATASAATDALEHLGRSSDEALIEALRRGDAAKRIAILPLVRSKSAGTYIRELLTDEDPEVRARACEALARIGDASSVKYLFDALADTSPRVTHAATSAILAIGSSETEKLALEAARATRPTIRRHAIRVIGAFGYPSAFDVLRAAIGESDRRIAELAITGLGSIDDPRIDPLLTELAGSKEDALRAAVMRAAGLRSGEAAVRVLMRGLSDPAPWVRYYAAQGLGRIGDEAGPDASKLLIERLRDPAPHVRVAVIEALAKLRTQEAWDAVVRAATSRDADERRAGLVGVGLHRREGSASILVEAARSDDPATRLVAISALAHYNEPEALATLEAALRDSTEEVRDAALSVLADRDDEAAARILVDTALRSQAEHPVHRALSRPGQGRVSVITAQLAKADPRTAPLLVAALGRMGTPSARQSLFGALSSSNPASRSAAASALVATGADDAVHAVSQLAITDPDPEVRRVCAAALAMS
jgi:HEAT repeat protein